MDVLKVSRSGSGSGGPTGSSSASGPSGRSGPPHPASSTSSGTPAGAPGPGGGVSGGSGRVLAGPRDAAQQLKRRRGHDIVTPTACTECRKKRAKCDGQRPCRRCAPQKDVTCVYKVPVRQSKENLRTELEQLRQRQRSNEQVIAALTRPNFWQEVLNRLRGGQSVEAISDWLGTPLPADGRSLPSFSRAIDTGGDPGGSVSSLSLAPSGPAKVMGPTLSPITGQPPGSPGPLPPLTQLQYGHIPSLRAPEMEQSQPSPWDLSTQLQRGVSTGSEPHAGLMDWTADIPVATWTDITTDVDFIQHLLTLYFCWEYPTFASLSKEHFLKDFKDGMRRYCSSMLVNALLALGCRFSTKPNTQLNPNDPQTFGEHFFRESLRQYHQEQDHHSLTTIQALGIMAIREASCGRDSESRYYARRSIRVAIEMGPHLNDGTADEDDVAVQAATFWGAFTLDLAWSLVTGSLPQCSHVLHLPPKPAIIGDSESSLWIPHIDDGVSLQRSYKQPSNMRSVYKCFCELSELVHQSLYILHSPGRRLTSQDLLEIHAQYLDWYDRIPVVLRLGHNFTPAVLFAHMYYHFAILLLFWPLIKLRIVGSKVSPRDMCSHAADAIQGLLRSYSQLYTLRRTPSFVPYFLLTSTIMHMAIAASSPSEPPSHAAQPQTPPPSTTGGSQHRLSIPALAPSSKSDPRVFKSIRQGIADLTEMIPCHHVAQQALNILRYLSKKWNLDVDMGRTKDTAEDVDNLTSPYSSSLNFFAPNVQIEDVICAWGTGGGTVIPRTEDVKGTKGKPKENLLFWPFQYQGRPVLPSGRELEEAGFAFI